MLTLIGLSVVALAIGVGVDKIIKVASQKVDAHKKENENE